MKLLIKANNRLNNVKVTKNSTTKAIESIEIDFEKDSLWSDLEFWLLTDNKEFLDHTALNVSKRNKIKTYKG